MPRKKPPPQPEPALPPAPAPADDPVLAYAEDVLAGRIVAGKLVKLACKRHLDDLEAGPKRGLRWDLKKALHVIDFFRFLRLTESPFDGQPFLLSPWQKFIVGSLFGWLGRGGYRRFRVAYVEVAKGGGKSPMAAALTLYGLVADGEQGAEIYCAATQQEQAKVVFRDAKNMAEMSPGLSKKLVSQEHAILCPSSRSFMRPVSSEHRGLDGKRPHIVVIDELHEHPTALVYEKMRAGTKARRQALIFEITNSGHDRDSVCWQHHELSVKILKGQQKNDAWFAYVCSLDPCDEHWDEGQTQPVDTCPECDDWHDETCWEKANPNVGVTFDAQYLREQVEEAEGMPSKEGIVRRLNFCAWTQSETAWLPSGLWARGSGPVDAVALLGCGCFGGLDIASKLDLCALVLCFPGQPSPGHYTLLAWFWLPKETAIRRDAEGETHYLEWEKEGLLTLTEGEVVDQDIIEEKVKELYGQYQIKGVHADPHTATQMLTHLQVWGVNMVEFYQTTSRYNEPTQAFEALLRERKMHHGDHGVLSWNAANVTVVTNRQGEVRPVKPDHHEAKKVDGVQASVMALAGAMMEPEPEAPWVQVWG